MKKYIFLISCLFNQLSVVMSMESASTQQERRTIQCPTCRQNYTTTNPALFEKTNENFDQRMCAPCQRQMRAMRNRVWQAVAYEEDESA